MTTPTRITDDAWAFLYMLYLKHAFNTTRVLTKHDAYARVRVSFKKNKNIQKATTKYLNNSTQKAPLLRSPNMTEHSPTFLTEKSVTPPGGIGRPLVPQALPRTILFIAQNRVTHLTRFCRAADAHI